MVAVNSTNAALTAASGERPAAASVFQAPRRAGLADPPIDRSGPVSHGLLLVVALVVAWRPVETHPWSAVLAAGSIVVLIPWAWRRRGSETCDAVSVVGLSLLVVACSAISGWDPSRAVASAGLALAMAAMVWLSSRSRPPATALLLLTVGLAGLAVWGLWQVAALESLRPELTELSGAAKFYAEERLASRRAFASLPLPGHLAVLLATALPILLSRIRRTGVGVVAGCAAVVAIAGLVATRSPVGLGLGVVGAIAVGLKSGFKAVVVAVLVFTVALAAVIAVRPDVARLEPVALRIDNWTTAGWLWMTSPFSGVGVASFAQASQAAPLEVGNRPAHAHDLPLEILAELGPAGFAATLILAAALVGVVRQTWDEDRALAVAVAIVPIHNLVDFSLFTSGVGLPWAVLTGWAMAYRSSGSPSRRRRAGGNRVVLVLAAAVAFAATVFSATSVAVERSAAADADTTRRYNGAVRALRLAPWRIEPQFLLATAAVESREPELFDRAWAELERHRWLRPRSASLAERRARVALARGDLSTALAELRLAVQYGSVDAPFESEMNELIAVLEDRQRDPRR